MNKLMTNNIAVQISKNVIPAKLVPAKAGSGNPYDSDIMDACSLLSQGQVSQA
jgi:hypothetical protein